MGGCLVFRVRGEADDTTLDVVVTEATSRTDLPPQRELKVLWVHNTVRTGGMFLWDVLDAIPTRIEVDEVMIPVKPGWRAIVDGVKQIRTAARSAEIVHAQFGSLVGLLASFAPRPLVLSLRGTDLYVLPASTLARRIESRLRQVLTYFACLRADIVVVMSERMRRELRRWPLLRRKRVLVMTDPIGNEFLDDGHQNRAKLALERSRPFSVLVGSFSGPNPVKRIWLVEQAVAHCAAIGLPVTLRVVSGLPRPDVKKAMQESDVVALASTHEGWPNIIKEALACGLPFIATDVSDLRALCGPQEPNRIIEADDLDIALTIIDTLAYRECGDISSSMYPEVVGVKHEMIYNYIAERR